MKNLSLYELSATYIEAFSVLSDPEIDIPTQTIADTLESLEDQLQDKCINVAKFIRNLESTTQAIKDAETLMVKRRKAIEKRTSFLKSYLKDNMDRFGTTQIDSPWFKISLRNNPPRINITDEELIPQQFKNEVTTLIIDKLAIKTQIKNGEVIPGVCLIQGQRLEIR